MMLFGLKITWIGNAEAERIELWKDLGLKHTGIFTGLYKNEFTKGNATPHAGWSFASSPSDREITTENCSSSQFCSAQAWNTRTKIKNYS